MWEDPIVAEVHRTRQELAKKFGFDVNAIVADIRQRQTALGSRVVSLDMKKPAEPTAEADRGRDSASPASKSSAAVPVA